ncbi:MAG: hypothetical protein HRU15_00120 [Planctomycetes bacterium]|nr:hypothetical protein [Planctomycetota bacterium]
MTDHPFEHFVVLMMENQSFDRLFGFVDGIGKLDGSQYATNADGEKIFAQPGAHPVQDHRFDPPHSTAATLGQLWGNNTYSEQAPDGSGWLSSHWPKANRDAETAFMRCCDDQDQQLPAMNTLAKNFVTCDRNFSSMPGPTAPNRLFLHAASSAGYTGHTWKPEDGLDMPPSMQTIFEALDDTDPSLGWNLYNIFPNMTTANAFPYVRARPERARSFAQFEEDCYKDQLPAYSVINPDLFVNSQHAGLDGSSLVDGDNYIASVYEALRRNKKVWEKTLFFITYDEAGGYWDSHIHSEPVPLLDPVQRHDSWPKENGPDYDFRYLGVRIPGLIISPWLDHSIDSTVFEHSSVAATVKKLFHTTARGPEGYLTVRDQHANDLISNLTLRSSPRTDLPYLPRSSYNTEMLEARAKYRQQQSAKWLGQDT